MWIYDPNRVCKYCGESDTLFNKPANYIFNVCYLCTRKQRNYTNRKNYPNYKEKKLINNVKWQKNNLEKFKESKNKHAIKKILVEIHNKENFYLTENI